MAVGAPDETTPQFDLLDHDAVVDYWNSRHQSHGELLSGGDVTYDHAANEAFYAVRLGRLLDLVDPASPPHARRRLLDAGCGKGWFSHALARCGFRVDGIDSSEHAIAEARTGAAPTETFAVSTLHEWTVPYLYDVVVSVDVLFHLTDDAVWAASVANLAALTKSGGRLLIADHEHPGAQVHGTYQVTRGSELYRAVLEPLGFRYAGFSPYRFRGNRGGFHTFERAA
jgi:2-polyprenyl-3-methyl-5-hydroxy-6-metoxy-1,4-benzoquinol methylase